MKKHKQNKNNLRNQLRNCLGNQVWDILDDLVWYQLADQMGDSLKTQPRRRLYNDLRNL